MRELRHDDDPTRRRRGTARPGPAGDEAKPATPAGDDDGLLRLQELVGNRGLRGAIGRVEQVPPEMRGGLEAAFGQSFADVRLHRGEAADAATERLGAAAVTAGRDVVLSSAAPELGSPAGRLLLAEELAHVAQGVGGVRPSRKASAEVESEARSAAARAVTGGPASVPRRPDAAGAVGLQDLAVARQLQLHAREGQRLMAEAIQGAPRATLEHTASEILALLRGVRSRTRSPSELMNAIGLVVATLSAMGGELAPRWQPFLARAIRKLRRSQSALRYLEAGPRAYGRDIAQTIGNVREDLGDTPSGEYGRGVSRGDATAIRSVVEPNLAAAEGAMSGSSPDFEAAAGSLSGQSDYLRQLARARPKAAGRLGAAAENLGRAEFESNVGAAGPEGARDMAGEEIQEAWRELRNMLDQSTQQLERARVLLGVVANAASTQAAGSMAGGRGE